MTPLCELARKYETDKGGEHLLAGQVCHNYTPIYYALLNARRKDMGCVLEVGVNKGGSLRMWQEFFPRATIIGFDVVRDCLYNETRTRCYYADQSNEASLRHAVAEVGPNLFDMIIDDGSHQTEHQITTMKTLLPFLAFDGIYVIEDFSSEDALDRVLAAVPKGFFATVFAAPGSIGPNPYIEKLLVIQPR